MKLTEKINQKTIINTNGWKEFKIKDFLSRVKIKSISSKMKCFSDGNIIVIGNSSENNGIIKKKQIEKFEYLHESNTLSYGAKGGKFFYQEQIWASTDHVHMFKMEKLNKYNALFICAILNKLIEHKGGWSSSLESSILEEKIKLPIDNNGNPDLKFMEEYIKHIYIYIYQTIYIKLVMKYIEKK